VKKHPFKEKLSAMLTIIVLAAVAALFAEEPKGFNPAGSNINGLGMRFVPVPGTNVQFSVFQTRVKDFRAFIRESGYAHMRETADPESRMWSLDCDGMKQRGDNWQDPGFHQTEDDPVVGVNWNDAKAFCEWLTVRERAAGRLPANWSYRLPRDSEWSLAVGLAGEDSAQTPEEKDGKIKDKYPWGQAWPPPAGAGNYAGEEANDGHWPPNVPVIQGYNDGYPRTAPVGSFKPNRFGIYDLGGNVCEWCGDEYRPGAGLFVLRGAAWSYRSQGSFYSSRRSYDPPGRRDADFGFRCVAGPSAP